MNPTDPRAATMPKAIETSYAGCRFRSRIEARWAVFLDELGILWQYEPQGFELPGGRYLPDFWLPDTMTWLEIKGAEPTSREQGKLIDLARAVCGDGHRAYLLYGDIPRSVPAKARRPSVPALTAVPLWAAAEEPERIYSRPAGDFAQSPAEDWDILDGTWQPGPGMRHLNAALTAARSARFEHGQHGA